MFKLECGSQKYAWGKKAGESMVAKLQSGSATELGGSPIAADPETRFAELWIGVHNSLPSRVLPSSGGGEGAVLLKDFLAQRADTYLGQEHMKFYNSPAVPFLLKVLSIDMALSIQAHPTRDLAKVLHARDPKNYPDPNHKPELIVALTPFEALCCFRPVKQMLYFIRQSPFVRMMVGEKAIAALEAAAVNEVIGTETKADAKAAVKLALEHLYAVDKATLEAAIKGQVDAITNGTLAHVVLEEGTSSSTRSSPDSYDSTVGAAAAGKKGAAGKGTSSTSTSNVPPLDAVHAVFVRTFKTFSYDVGLWMMYFLNYLQLNVGDGLFLGASEPHAYLSGDGVEIMANSDNVVRAGLTPKFKDVETLLNMLTYDTNALKSSKYTADTSTAVQQYAPPAWCDDFSLFAVRLSRHGLTPQQKKKGEDEQSDAANTNINATSNLTAAATKAVVDLPSVGLAVCVKGKARVVSHLDDNNDAATKSSSTVVGFGANFVLPIGKATFELEDGEDECTIFIGTTNVHGATSASKL